MYPAENMWRLPSVPLKIVKVLEEACGAVDVGNPETEIVGAKAIIPITGGRSPKNESSATPSGGIPSPLETSVVKPR